MNLFPYRRTPKDSTRIIATILFVTTFFLGPVVHRHATLVFGIIESPIYNDCRRSACPGFENRNNPKNSILGTSKSNKTIFQIVDKEVIFSSAQNHKSKPKPFSSYVICRVTHVGLALLFQFYSKVIYSSQIYKSCIKKHHTPPPEHSQYRYKNLFIA